jgi:hypothetical protein
MNPVHSFKHYFFNPLKLKRETVTKERSLEAKKQLMGKK